MHATLRTVLVSTLCPVFLLGMTPLAAGQSSSLGLAPERAGSWDFYVPLIYTADTEIDGKGGSKVEVNDDLGLGIAGGYNFNNHFQLGGSFNWNSRSYDATYVREDASSGRYGNSLEASTIALNALYYMLPGNITPFVSGSIGYTFLDTNIQNGPTQTTYYYDPWWGYVDYEYTPTRTESDFSYGAGLGLRVDLNEKFVMQFSYNKVWLNIDNATGSPDVDCFRIDFGFRMF